MFTLGVTVTTNPTPRCEVEKSLFVFPFYCRQSIVAVMNKRFVKLYHLLRSHHRVLLNGLDRRVLVESQDSTFGVRNARLQHIHVSQPATADM